MSSKSDSYFVPAKNSIVELKEKGSKFIGRVFFVTGADEIDSTLADLKKREYDATHHCFAWKLRSDPTHSSGESFRYYDDGEPNGSAGKPIYDQLCGAGVTNALCVVTRYFGGTKLGVGGLVRAYGAAAKAALEQSGAVERYDSVTYNLEVDFSLYTPLTRFLQEIQAETLSSEFGEKPKLSVAVRKSRVERFEERFTELTQGKGALKRR